MTMILDGRNDLYDDLFDDNDFTPADPAVDDTPPVNEPAADDEPNDDFDNPEGDPPLLIDKYLGLFGIEDSSQLQYEDENGDIIHKNFHELEQEEQLNLLRSLSTPVASEYTPSEIEAIEYLRKNNATLEDVAKYFKAQGVEEYLGGVNDDTTTYKIDDFSDDEIIAADYKSRFDFSDEQINDIIQKEKEDTEIFAAKANKLREEFKALESEQAQAAQNKVKEQQEQVFQEYVTSVNEAAKGFTNIGLRGENKQTELSIGVEDTDKEAVLKFMLDQDINGLTGLQKAFQDPNALFQAAWFLIKGQDTFDAVHQYYKKEIESARKPRSSGKPRVVNQPKTNTSKPLTAEDLLG